jgi:hypothetical protein
MFIVYKLRLLLFTTRIRRHYENTMHIIFTFIMNITLNGFTYYSSDYYEYKDECKYNIIKI